MQCYGDVTESGGGNGNLRNACCREVLSGTFGIPFVRLEIEMLKYAEI